MFRNCESQLVIENQNRIDWSLTKVFVQNKWLENIYLQIIQEICFFVVQNQWNFVRMIYGLKALLVRPFYDLGAPTIKLPESIGTGSDTQNANRNCSSERFRRN